MKFKEFRENKTIFQISKKEANKLLEIGVLYNPRDKEFKLMDKEENIKIELKGDLK